MLLLSLNQYRNIYIWLAFKVLSQCNMKETEQSYSLHEENCQCIICLSVTVSQHPFISGERDPVSNPTWQPYPMWQPCICGCAWFLGPSLILQAVNQWRSDVAMIFHRVLFLLFTGLWWKTTVQTHSVCYFWVWDQFYAQSNSFSFKKKKAQGDNSNTSWLW